MKRQIKRTVDRRLSGIGLTPAKRAQVLGRIDREEGTETMKKRYKFSSILIVALIGLMMLAGLAIAASRSNILEMLFWDAVPNDKAVELITPVDHVAEQNGIRLSVEETLFDRDRLSITFQIESLLDESVLLDLERFQPTVTVGGEYAFPNLISSGFGLLGDPIEEIAPGRVHTFTTAYTLPDGKEGLPADVSVKVIAMKPQVLLKPDRFRREPNENGEMPKLPGKNALYLSKDGFVSIYDYEIVHATMDAHYANAQEDTWANDTYSGSEAMIEAGMVVPFTEVELQFTLAPDTAAQSAGTRIKGQNTFEFEDYTLIITKMNFTATATQIEYEIYPKFKLPERDWDVEDDAPHSIERWYAFLDENGSNIIRNTAGSGGGGGGREIDPDGKEYLAYGYEYGPAQSIPKQVTVIPINNYVQQRITDDPEDYYAEEREHFDWDEAVTVEVE